MYAFVHIEKTGGSTLNTIFRRAFGTRHCDIRLPLAKRRMARPGVRICVEADDVRRIRRIYRHVRGISGHNVKPYADFSIACPEIRFVTIVRDPVARFRSHFINRGGGNSREAFDAWLAQPRVRNWQTKMIAGEPNAERAIELIATRFGFVGLTERFDESLLLLARWLDEPGLRAPYRIANRTSDKRRQRDLERERCDMTYLDSADVVERVCEANLEDQKVVEFVRTTVYPRQVERYDGDLAADLRGFQRECSGVRLSEPLWGRVMRNYVYKPLLHCGVV